MPHLTHGRRVPGNAFTAQSRRALRWPLPLRDARLSTGPPQKRPSKMRRGTAGMPTDLITGANRGLGLAFAPQYATSGLRVVAITSRLGSMAANSDGGLYAYRSSKAALNAVWRSFALDHPDVIAALVHPGWVRTDMGGAGALLDPEQSVAGLRRVIAGLAKADSGRFYNYDGSPIPW